MNVTSLDDAGSYECRVKNKVDKQTAKKFSKVIVHPKPKTSYDSNRSDQDKGFLAPCDEHLDRSFCYNGGTCTFYSNFKEASCV